MKKLPAHHHYNPDWFSDDDLLASFVARQDEFAFLRDELARAPLQGSVQHYLLVGARGAGKTTLLKRLAIAIRRDTDLHEHLVALSFPEELYQVKNLADFWWASCDALVDELDSLGHTEQVNKLIQAIDQGKETANKASPADPLADTGFKLLLKTCAELARRPVLLLDNLDLVFRRIDKTGRKLKDPYAPAYWALREALSTVTSPIVIGGSVSLAEPFTGYDKAFYDFFIPKRLGKLSLDEAQQVLERLADAHDAPEVRKRLRERPGRIEALFELTGGNPRALGLIFELLCQGPNSRAVEDFERLMDITTPYYKARFEDLSEQAQVVMHALAVRHQGSDGLRFGHTAAELATHAGLATNTVSAQLDILEREGLAEKSAAHGRTQYRIAEQLFRLWLQMRSTRRVRHNVLGLTEFLEAMFDLEELRTNLQTGHGESALADAKFAFAVAATDCAAPLRRGLEAHGADRLLQHLLAQEGAIDDYLGAGDLPADLEAVVRLRERLRQCSGVGLTAEEQDALLGSVQLRLDQKQACVDALCAPATAQDAATRLRPRLAAERRHLLRLGLHESDLPMLFNKRARGHLPLPMLTPQHADTACLADGCNPTFQAMVWRLLGARQLVKLASDQVAQDWLNWGRQHAENAGATEWANVAGTMRRSARIAHAKDALDYALDRGSSSRTWYERGMLAESEGDFTAAETAFREAIRLDPTDSVPWNSLGVLLADKLNRFDEAEAAYRKAIKLDAGNVAPWNGLGILLGDKLNRFDEAEAAYRKAIEIDPDNAAPWNNLGILLAEKLSRFDEAEAAYRRAIEIDPDNAAPWNNLGILQAAKQSRFDQAETAYRKSIKLAPGYMWPWKCLGDLLAGKLSRFDEAEAAYRKAIELNPDNARLRNDLGDLHTRRHLCAARQALDAGDQHALHDALGRLIADTGDIAASLVSRHLVENFLATVLADGRMATPVLAAMRDLGYEKHARPLLLAFEAAIEDRPAMLAELEPEVQTAAMRMFERLRAGTGEA